MQVIRLFFVFVFSILLSSCGGGSSSGGGGASTQVYSANGPFNVTGPGGTVSGQIPITITVTGNTVTITDGTDTGSAPLSADGINFIVPVNIVSLPGLSCNSPVILSGTINGANVSGTYGGSSTCVLNGVTANLSYSGSFSGTQTSAAKSSHGPGFADLIGGAAQ